jgi:hypothetical protein
MGILTPYNKPGVARGDIAFDAPKMANQSGREDEPANDVRHHSRGVSQATVK